jgi:hypothetical protein
MFKAVRVIEGHRYTFLGVVLGQHNGPLINAGLDASADLVNSVTMRLATEQPRQNAAGRHRR